MRAFVKLLLRDPVMALESVKRAMPYQIRRVVGVLCRPGKRGNFVLPCGKVRRVKPNATSRARKNAQVVGYRQEIVGNARRDPG